jgi:hypothetical protein
MLLCRLKGSENLGTFSNWSSYFVGVYRMPPVLFYTESTSYDGQFAPLFSVFP